MSRLIFITLISLFLVFFGCLNNLEGFQDYVDNESVGDVEVGLEVTDIDNTCYCMLCTHEDAQTWPYNILFDQNLYEGSCSFFADCNEESLNEKIEQEYTPAPFMLGMGPRPWDFTFANSFCNNSLSFVTHWLVSDGEEYVMNDLEETRCFLENNVIPMYVFYSNSTAIDSDSAREIAEKVNDFGPVILVSEIDFDSSNPDVVEQVKQQILAMRDACPASPSSFGDTTAEPYCLIAVAPKLNDYEGLDALLSDPAIANSVDMVAVGVNSRYLNSDECKAASLYYEALNFSEYAWHNYSKPVIWPYMLFDPDSTNKEGTCHWSQFEVNEAYFDFYGKVLPSAIRSGVVGAAPYLFYALGEPADPLGCPGCGLITVSGAELVPNGDLFHSWFYGCQKYLPEKNHIILSFPKEEAGTCNLGFSGGLFLDKKITTGQAAGYYFASDEEEETIFSCLSCIQRDFGCEESDYEDGGKCDPDPYGFEEYKNNLEYYCGGFEELDLWASIRGIDPALVRALAFHESGLNIANPGSSYCAVSFPVSIGHSCNPLNVWIVEDPDYLKYPHDPTAHCQDEIISQFESDGIESLTVQEYNEMVGQDLVDGSPNSKIKPCAYGLMQIASGYPYTYWSENLDYGYSEQLLAPGTDPLNAQHVLSDGFISAMQSCGPEGEFNPFNGSHNACMGTWILKGKIEVAENQVNNALSNPEAAEALDLDNNIKKKWLTTFLAIYGYAGYDHSNMDIANTNGWLHNFVFNRMTEEECEANEDDEFVHYCCADDRRDSVCCNADEHDFIQFVTCCMEYDPSYDYGGYCDPHDEARDLFDKNDRTTGFKRLVSYYSFSQDCDYSCGASDTLATSIQNFIDKYS